MRQLFTVSSTVTQWTQSVTDSNAMHYSLASRHNFASFRSCDFYWDKRWQNRLGIKCGLRTCGPADRQRNNLRTKNLRTVTADHGIKCGPQFADLTGVKVFSDILFLMFNAPAYCLFYRVGQIKWHHFTFLLVTKDVIRLSINRYSIVDRNNRLSNYAAV